MFKLLLATAVPFTLVACGTEMSDVASEYPNSLESVRRSPDPEPVTVEFIEVNAAKCVWRDVDVLFCPEDAILDRYSEHDEPDGSDDEPSVSADSVEDPERRHERKLEEFLCNACALHDGDPEHPACVLCASFDEEDEPNGPPRYEEM